MATSSNLIFGPYNHASKANASLGAGDVVAVCVFHSHYLFESSRSYCIAFVKGIVSISVKFLFGSYSFASEMNATGRVLSSGRNVCLNK